MHCAVYAATEDAKKKKKTPSQVWQRTLPFFFPPKGDEPEAAGPMCGNACCPLPRLANKDASKVGSDGQDFFLPFG